MSGLYPALFILGIVQGITEFLPVSSSGHLAIIENISYMKERLSVYGSDAVIFINVAFHVATLVAVVLFLWKDIISITRGFFSGIFSRDLTRPGVKAAVNILVATIPAGTVGVLFEDLIKEAFTSIRAVFILLIINGIILLLTKKIVVKSRKIEEMGLFRSFIIGLCQAVAIVPGISRSGMTISGGMLGGLEPAEAARFSFLMSIPVIAGAGLLEGVKIAHSSFPVDLLFPLLAAMVFTVFTALVALKVLMAIVKQVRIHLFGFYTIAMGLVGFILTMVF